MNPHSDGLCLYSALEFYACPLVGSLQGNNLRQHKLPGVGNRTGSSRVSAEQCAAACLAERRCVSFDHSRQAQLCFLGDAVLGRGGERSVPQRKGSAHARVPRARA